MILFNYTKSPRCNSLVDQSFSIDHCSQSFCIRSGIEEANTCRLRTDGPLRDISSTLLNLLNLGLQKEMTGGDLRAPIVAK